MIPIHELLNRIRWDPEFAKGNFELGYYDRAENRIITVPLKEVTFPTESPSTFQLLDQEGQVHRVPFHRAREVYKDGQRIWHRPDPSATEIKELMSLSQSYLEFVLEQLGRVTPVTVKPMFGGVGIYAQGLFFALIAEDRLYFKVDDTTRPEFECLGMEPFQPFGETHALGYYEAGSEWLHSRLIWWCQERFEIDFDGYASQPSHTQSGHAP